MRVPKFALVAGSMLAVVRFGAFIVVRQRETSDAQWQLAYLPFWFSDWPVSTFYRLLPYPFAEAVVGPGWWFCVGIVLSVVSGAIYRRHAASN